MKKSTVILLMVAFATTLIACSKRDEANKSAGGVAQKRIIVGMATDANGLGDGSFNDGVYAGLKKAEEEGLIEIRLIEPAAMTDYVPNLSGLAEDGAELVFAVGFLFYDALLEVAPNYPNTMFAGIDLFYASNVIPANVLGINWKEHESGYLAGVIAGLMTKQYADRSDKLNDENVIGAVLGMDIPPVERYFVGFAEGAKSVNPDVEVLSVVTGTFTDQAKGKEATIAMAEQGADIVIQFAGLTGMGIFTAAQEKNILVMGADVDQNRFAPEYTLTSAMKGTTQATYLTTLDYVNGNFKGGENAVFGIAEEAIGLAPFHDFDSIVPSDVVDAVEQAKTDILSGAVEIPQNRSDAGM